MFTDAFVRFLQRVSVQPCAWLDLREVFEIERLYAPLAELCLFSRWHGEGVDRGIERLALEGTFACTEQLSARPIHDGFVASLRFEMDPSGVHGATQARAFVAREIARNTEQHLRELYGEPTEALLSHDVFRLMDYPMFDQGSASIDFGLMIERDRKTRWLWSRVVFAHK